MALPNLSLTGNMTEDVLKEAEWLSVEVTQELNQHSWCKVLCRRSDNSQDQRLLADTLPGLPLKVTYTDQDGTQVEMFDGWIIDVEFTYEISGSYAALITAVTQSYFMDLTPRCAYYAQQDVIGIAKKLLQQDAVPDTDATFSVSAPKKMDYVQWGETDWHFLNRLADDNEAWMRPQGSAIGIHDSFQPGSKLQWRDEHGLISFRTKGTIAPLQFDGAHYQSGKMQSKTYEGVEDQPDFYDKSAGIMVDTVKNGAKILPSGYVYQRSRVPTLEDFENLLKKESRRSLGGSVSAHGESMNPKLKPGDTVDISGLPDSNGTYGLTKVIHRFTTTGYLNEFSSTPWKKYTNPQPPVSQKSYGVVPARVVDNNDPNGMGRIQVQFFWQEDSQTRWARMMTPYAGADRGFMFLPEVGDEVIVTFGDGDVDSMVILGSIWNGVDKPPREDFWGGDVGPNDVKRIVTKSGHRIQIVDKQGKESITLSTPKKVRISMLESCAESGGRPTMSMYSAGDIYLYAPNGRVHIHSKYFSKEIGGTSSDYFDD